MTAVEKRLTIDHALVHIIFQAMAGIVYGFTVYLLMARGFNSAIAGFSMSFANLGSLFIQPMVANFLDKTKKYTVFDICVYISIIMVLLYVASCLITNATVLLFVIYTLSIAAYSSLEPLFNSLSSVFINSGINIEFGRARALGSVSYGLICFIFGLLTENYTYTVVLIGGCIFAILICLISLIIRKDYNKADKTIKEKEDVNIIGFGEFIKENKTYIILCICLAGIFFGYTICDNFTILIVENVGGSSKDMGAVLCIKAVLEGIFIFFYSNVRKHIKLNTLLTVSMIGFILKNFVTWKAESVMTIYIVQILQIFSFAIILPAMVEYVNTNMDEYVAIRGHAFFTLTIVIGSTFSGTIGGIVSDKFGISTTMFIGLIATIISAIGFISTLGAQKIKHKN